MRGTGGKWCWSGTSTSAFASRLQPGGSCCRGRTDRRRPATSAVADLILVGDGAGVMAGIAPVDIVSGISAWPTHRWPVRQPVPARVRKPSSPKPARQPDQNPHLRRGGWPRISGGQKAGAALFEGGGPRRAGRLRQVASGCGTGCDGGQGGFGGFRPVDQKPAGVTGGKAAPGQQVRRAYGEGSVHAVRLCVVQVAEQAAARRVGMARLGGMGGGIMNRFGQAHVAAKVDENDVRPPRRRGFGQAGKDGRSDWRSTRG